MTSLSANVTAPAQYLFNRIYAVTVYDQNGAGKVWGNDITATATDATGKAYPCSAALRITFDVSRSPDAATDANKAVVTLFNLSRQSRDFIKENMYVRLRAGYAGRAQTLAYGLITNISDSRSGGDVACALEFSCGGEEALNFAIMNRTYKSGQKIVDVLQDCANLLSYTLADGLQVTTKQGVVASIPDETFNSSFVAHGPIGDTLKKLCEPRNLTYNITNGFLNVLPKNAALQATNCPLLSAATGLVNVPSKSLKALSVTSLLNPNIVPQGYIKVVSRVAHIPDQKNPGFYIVNKVKHSGDSHAGNWQTDAECVMPDDQTITTLTVAQAGNLQTAVVKR